MESKTPRTDKLKAQWCENPTNDTRYWTDQLETFETELAEARAEIERKDKLIEQMRKTLEDIAAQRLSSEMSGSDLVDAEGCYEDAYEIIIRGARAALSAAGGGEL